MATLTLDDDEGSNDQSEKEPPKVGDVWRLKEEDREINIMLGRFDYVYITGFEYLGLGNDLIIGKEYFNDDNTINFEEQKVPSDTFLKEYQYSDKQPQMTPKEPVLTRNKDVDVTKMDIRNIFSMDDEDNNISDSGSLSGADDINLSDSDNGSDSGRFVETLDKQLKKKATTKKKRLLKKNSTSQPKSKRRRNKLTSINWNYLSENYDTLFYPKHNGKVVPQVMTIAGVKQKEMKRASAKGPKLVYIFKVKHNNNNIDEEIERWSDWRRDLKSVNSWVQQIGRMIKNCENDGQQNFLKALRRSFTITMRTFRTNEDKNDSFKQEMAVCYVHFIKDEGTDHTWGKFKQYMDKSENCRKLKNKYKEKKNKKRKG